MSDALPVRVPPLRLESWCAECGPCVTVDEDGCCVLCGTDSIGAGAREAHRNRAQIATIEKRIERARHVVRSRIGYLRSVGANYQAEDGILAALAGTDGADDA